MADTAQDSKQVSGLFYSKKDKKLFYIPGYYTNGTGILKDLLKNLKSGEDVIRRFAPEGDIYSREIKTSSRYKSMWYFAVALDECPEEAFELGDDWTMFDWIER